MLLSVAIILKGISVVDGWTKVIESWRKTMGNPDWYQEYNWLLTRKRVEQWTAGEDINWEDYV